jgi:hypothetical protein
VEFGNIHIQDIVGPQRDGQGRDDLSDKYVENGGDGSFDMDVPSADIGDGLVKKHDSDVSVLK